MPYLLYWRDIYLTFLNGRVILKPQVLQWGLFRLFFPLVVQHALVALYSDWVCCKWPQQVVSVSINQGSKVTHTITWPPRTLRCATQRSISPPYKAFYHSRCLIVKMDDIWDRGVTVTVWTVHGMAHRPCCNHDSRKKTENRPPLHLQLLNEVTDGLSALWGKSQITYNEPVPFQDIFEI